MSNNKYGFRCNVGNWKNLFTKSYKAIHWILFEVRCDHKQIAENQRKYFELRMRSSLDSNNLI